MKVRDEHPPWLEVTPLYDVIAPLHHVHSDAGKEIKNPQSRCDFLITYADDKGPLAPALLDVKSRKPAEPIVDSEKWSWQITSAMRRGFVFQIAYPKNRVQYPTCLEEWEIRTPCLECKKLSENCRNCSECGLVIFPFTIVGAADSAFG